MARLCAGRDHQRDLGRVAKYGLINSDAGVVYASAAAMENSLFRIWPEQRGHAIVALVLTAALGLIAATQRHRLDAEAHEFESLGLELTNAVIRDSIAREARAKELEEVSRVRVSNLLSPEDQAIALEATRDLRKRKLFFPVPNMSIDDVHDTFEQTRAGGKRLHYATDIHAPRGTPVLSMDSGSIVQLHTSAAGGISVYAADSREKFIYFYAHLDRYHKGLREGMALHPGDTLGYVGTTGNAPPTAPHLHLSILKARNIRYWSRGVPVNPIDVF